MVKTYEEMKCMPIDAPEGTKVVFAFPNNGEQVDKDRLGRLGLKVGAEFTVEETEISGFSTTLYLREFPEEWFNTVNFTLTANAEFEERKKQAEKRVRDFIDKNLTDPFGDVNYTQNEGE